MPKVNVSYDIIDEKGNKKSKNDVLDIDYLEDECAREAVGFQEGVSLDRVHITGLGLA